jgi:hypothetical protein
MKMADKIDKLSEKVRDLEDELRSTRNRLADLTDAVQEIVMFGPTDSGLSYLSEIYFKVVMED